MEQGIESLQVEAVNPPKQQWRSNYNSTALKTLDRLDGKMKVYPPDRKDTIEREKEARRDKLSRCLDAIDREVVDNFRIFDSQEFPGVRIPLTSVSVKKIEGLSENPTDEKSTYVLFTPFSPPPGGDPDDIMNAVYDRVINILPEARRNPSKNFTVYALGLPTSKLGSVSAEWVNDLKKGVEETEEGAHGFPQHGRLYAEFLRTVLGQEHIRFYGSSMGSILASETAKHLPEIWNNLQVLTDVPTGTHKPTGKTIKLPFVGRIPLSAKGIQILAGFGAEVFLRTKFDTLVKTSFAAKQSARQELLTTLGAKGILPHNTSEDIRLKKDAFSQEIKLLVKGTPFDTDDFRSYVVQGMLDPSTITVKRIFSLLIGEKFFSFGNRSLGMGINYTHWMDRGRWINRWIKKIEQFKR